MTVSVTTEVIGLRELEKALEDLGEEVAGKNGGLVRSALMSAALPVLRDAQQRAPKETGRLRGAISRRRAKNPTRSSETIFVQVKPGRKRDDLKGAWYAHFIEFGTVKMAARPFLRPALESNKTNSVNLFRTKLGGGIERVAKKIGNENAARVGAKAKKL